MNRGNKAGFCVLACWGLLSLFMLFNEAFVLPYQSQDLALRDMNVEGLISGTELLLILSGLYLAFPSISYFYAEELEEKGRALQGWIDSVKGDLMVLHMQTRRIKNRGETS